MNTKKRDENFREVSDWFEELDRIDDIESNWAVIKKITQALLKNVILLNKENGFL